MNKVIRLYWIIGLSSKVGVLGASHHIKNAQMMAIIGGGILCLGNMVIVYDAGFCKLCLTCLKRMPPTIMVTKPANAAIDANRI